MSAQVIHLEDVVSANVDELAEAFRLAKIRANDTLALEDMLAAGLAWRRFLMAFESPEQRRASVAFIDFGRRGR